MSEKVFTVVPDPERLRSLSVLKRPYGPGAQPAAADELRSALVTLVDWMVQGFGAVPSRIELPDGLWTVGQLSQWMQIPETTVLEYARDGKIPSVRVGKHVRFDPRAVMRALE